MQHIPTRKDTWRSIWKRDLFFNLDICRNPYLLIPSDANNFANNFIFQTVPEW